jgi:hypothetical protein
MTPVSADDFLFTRSDTYPTVVADFERSINVLVGLECDVLVTPHPNASRLWQRVESPNERDRLVDGESCRRYAANARELLATRLARERAGAAGGEAPERGAAARDASRSRPTAAPLAAALSDSLFGVVAARSDSTCLVVPAQRGAPPDTVVIVVPSDQRVLRAVVGGALASCPADLIGAAATSYYRISVPGLDAGDLGIAILVAPARASGAPRTDTDG